MALQSSRIGEMAHEAARSEVDHVGSARRTRSSIRQSCRHNPARGCASPRGGFPTDTVSVAVSSDSDPTAFSIFIESPGANMNSWPGKNSMGTAFIGRIPLAANEGTCCIVANQEPVRLNPAQFRIPK
jgi:hypothetical protein